MNTKVTISLIFFLTLFGILFFTKSSLAASYYVKNGGNDTAAGTSDTTAWAHSPGMVGWTGSATLKSGDIIYFRSQDTWSIAGGGNRNLLAITTAGVTFDGSSWGSGTRAKIFASAASSEELVGIKADNVTFKGFEVDGNSTNSGGVLAGSYYYGTSGVIIDNSIVHNIGGSDNFFYALGALPSGGSPTSNLTITNNKVYHTAHEGILLYPGNGVLLANVTVRGNEVYDTGVYNRSVFGVGVLIKNNSKGHIIEFNYVHDTVKGIEFQTTTGSPTNVTVRYNIIANNTDKGMWFLNDSGNSSQSVDVYGNLFIDNGYNNGSYGSNIEWPGGGNNQASATVNIYNNTFFAIRSGTAHNVHIGSGAAGTPTINFKDNIIYTANIIPIEDLKGWLIHSNNLVFRTSSASDSHVVRGGTSYNRSGVLTWESTAQNTDPNFKNISSLPTGITGTYGSSMEPNTDGLSLLSSSLGINNGSTLASPYNGAVNLSGKGLTRSGSFDIGAYEYVSSSPPPDTTPPAAPANVRVS